MQILENSECNINWYPYQVDSPQASYFPYAGPPSQSNHNEFEDTLEFNYQRSRLCTSFIRAYLKHYAISGVAHMPTVCCSQAQWHQKSIIHLFRPTKDDMLLHKLYHNHAGTQKMQNELKVTVNLQHKPLASALIRTHVYYHVFLSAKVAGD